MELNKIKELINERNQCIKEARAINDACLSAGKKLEGEDRTKYDTLMAREEELREMIKREEELRKREKEALHDFQPEPGDDDLTKRHTADFRKFMMGEITAADMRTRYDEKYRATAEPQYRALQIDIPQSGGYLLPPPVLLARLIKVRDNSTVIRSMATTFTTGPEGIMAPSLDNDPIDPVSSGEITAVNEDSTMSFGKRNLVPKDYDVLVKASRKFVRSVPGGEGIIIDRLGYKTGIKQEKDFMTGTAANKSLGVFVDSSLGISSSRDVTASPAVGSETAWEEVIDFDDLIDVQDNNIEAYQRDAAWVMHRNVKSGIRKLKDGNGQYQWQASTQVGEPDMLLGAPVRLSEYAPNTLAVNSYALIYGSFSEYWIADGVFSEIQILKEKYSNTKQWGYQLMGEVDGMPVTEEAFTRLVLAAA